MEIGQTKRFILICLFIFIIKGIFASAYVYPLTMGTTPDDVGHLSYISYIAEEKKLPILNYSLVEKNLETAWREYKYNYEILDDIQLSGDFSGEELNWIAQHPPLYYLLMVSIYWLITAFSRNMQTVILGMRMISVLVGALSLLLLCDTLRRMTKNRYTIMTGAVLFTFSSTVFGVFCSISNDVLLILLSLLLFRYSIMYADKKDSHTFWKFVLVSAFGMITKVTFALILVSCLGYLLIISVSRDGIKETLKLVLLGAIIGGILLLPVYGRNYMIYGKFFVSANQLSGGSYCFTLPEFLFDKGYLKAIYTSIVCQIQWERMIFSTSRMRKFVTFILLSSAIGYCIRNKDCVWIPVILGVMGAVFLRKMNLGMTVGLAFFSAFYILLISILKGNQQQRFLAVASLVVLVIYGVQHYQIYCVRGVFRGINGRYYFITLFPAFYLLFNGIENLPDRVQTVIFFGICIGTMIFDWILMTEGLRAW